MILGNGRRPARPCSIITGIGFRMLRKDLPLRLSMRAVTPFGRSTSASARSDGAARHVRWNMQASGLTSPLLFAPRQQSAAKRQQRAGITLILRAAASGEWPTIWPSFCPVEPKKAWGMSKRSIFRFKRRDHPPPGLRETLRPEGNKVARATSTERGAMPARPQLRSVELAPCCDH